MSKRTCRECSNPLKPTAKPNAEFCNTSCRIAWRNRRCHRGAELYDLFMAWRYDRERAKVFHLWSLMCRMASVWHEEDKAAGRKSYFSPRASAIRYVHYVATAVRGVRP